MKRVTILMLLISGMAFAQQNKVKEDLAGTNCFGPQAQFKGGDSALMHYLQKNLNYPKLASNCGCEGTVYLSFVVNETGKITNAKVLRGVYCPKDKLCAGAADSINDEALRLINNMPTWEPGTENGEPEKIQYYLPVKFSLK